MKIKSVLIITILLVAGFLRIYHLDSIPPHLTPDEAALGYNAYSILKTGRDEHGVFLPIVFKSFGDYKPGLYVYSTIPFIATFGLNEFSVRIPSALFGIFSIYLVYLVSKELFKKDGVSLFAAFFLAISPWHMFFSRGAWEINLAATLTLLGIYCFLKAFKYQKYFLLSALFFGSTLLAYQGAKLSSSIVVFLLIAFYFKDVLLLSKRILVGGFFIGLIISSPIILSVFTGQAQRLTIFSVFNQPRPESYLQNILSQSSESKGSLSYYLFHSESYNFFRGVMGRWFNHFSGRFLFFEGDFSNPRHAAPYSGELILPDILLLVVGIYIFLKKSFKKEYLFILLWLLMAPLPAILSRDQVHAVRSFNMVIPLSIIISIGAWTLYERLKKEKLVLFVAVILYIFGFIYYLDAYFVHLPKLNSKYWEYGYKQIVQEITKEQPKHEKIIVQQSYAQPYIYFLFYNKYDPSKYQEISKSNYIASAYGDVGQIKSLENISFEGIDWSVLRGKTGTLVVGDTERIPEGDSKEGTEFHVVSEIKYLDNKNTAFRIIEIK